MLLGFYLLSYFLGLIQFQLPGTEGAVASDLREIPLLISIFFLQSPISVILEGLMTGLFLNPEASGIATSIAHAAGLLAIWIPFQQVQRLKVGRFTLGFIWLGMVFLYFYAIIIPLIIWVSELDGKLEVANFWGMYSEFGKVVLFELLVSGSVSALFFVQIKTRKALRKHLEQLEETVAQRTQELAKSIDELSVSNEELQQTQEEIAAQRDLVATKNQQLEAYKISMSQSIEAAKDIQSSILPTKKELNQAFADHFVLFLPKDVVSGDFYWIYKHEDYTVLVEADCTGHGVPGAFMTLIGHAILEHVVKSEQVKSPKLIMQRIHEQLRSFLTHESTKNRYGMDMSIVVTEPIGQEVKLTFGGASQRMYYWNKETQELQSILGSKKKIGGKEIRHKVFAETQITVPKGTEIFLGSDGFSDQNNAQRRRVGRRNLESLLAEAGQMPVAEQKACFQQFLTKHQGDEPQRDDILIMGVVL